MTIQETLAIIGFIVLSTTLSVAINRKIMQLIAGLVIGKIESLNEELRDAVAFISEGGSLGSAAQDTNPLVGVFAQILQQKMQEPLINAEIMRSDNGKFKKIPGSPEDISS